MKGTVWVTIRDTHDSQDTSPWEHGTQEFNTGRKGQKSKAVTGYTFYKRSQGQSGVMCEWQILVDKKTKHVLLKNIVEGDN